MATKTRENGCIDSTITGAELGKDGQITVIRKRAVFDEIVFDNKEQFEYWKLLSDFENEDERGTHPDFGTDTFDEFNDKNFVNSFLEDDVIDPPLHAAFFGDQTICTDDIIDNGHFDKHARESWELSSLKVAWED